MAAAAFVGETGALSKQNDETSERRTDPSLSGMSVESAAEPTVPTSRQVSSASAWIQAHTAKKLVISLCMVIGVWATSQTNAFQRLDNLFYDVFIKVHEREVGDQIVIIAIDDKSLRELGRWPWPRRVHGALLNRLTEAGTAAVGFDVLFAGPDASDPAGDAELAKAINDNGKVVLALAPEMGANGITELWPHREFGQAAASVGHVDFELDQDGLVREVFLDAGIQTPRWPAFGLALLDVARGETSEANLVLGSVSSSDTPVWVRKRPTRIAFAGAPGHFPSLSYIDVLNGEVSTADLANKIVLVGAEAAGMGDRLATPQSSAHQLMSGVEVNANVAATLRDGLSLHAATLQHRLAVAGILILALSLGMLVRARLALPLYLFSLAATLLTSLVLLYAAHLWVAPTVTLAALSILYISWSWLEFGKSWKLSRKLNHKLHNALAYDSVTGLPNRKGFEKAISLRLSRSENHKEEFGILLISMGRHRSVIDLAGIQGNDKLHNQIKERLIEALPKGQLPFRLDGSEFAVIVDCGQGNSVVDHVSAKVVQSLLRSFSIEGHLVEIAPSIGSSLYPADGTAAQTLIDNAYTAMHRARKDRACSYYPFSAQLREDISKTSTIVQSLRDSTWQDQLECVYQPQIALGSRRIIGVETLVRWPHPILGHISPAEFIPIAEDEGLIVPISNWILEQACATGHAWRERHNVDIRVAVNLSAIQLNRPDVSEIVAHVLQETGLPASALELEVTETALLVDTGLAVENLQKLKSLGVEIAIDDFGTGYSSLTYLKDFPADRVKIDQSFISDIHESKESADITASIIAMAHRMGLKVIAEGVERTEHLAFLLQQGCEEAQGFFIAKPMAAAEFERLLIAGNMQMPRNGILAANSLLKDARSA